MTGDGDSTTEVDGVTEVAPGDFVVLNWRAVCGQCRACAKGQPWYCFATHNAEQKMTIAETGEELTPALLTLGEIQRVLQALLDEEVSVRDLVRIFEGLSERARTSKDTELLVEAARANLGAAISTAFAVDGRLPVLTFEPLAEHAMLEALRPGDGGSFLALDPSYAERLVIAVATEAQRAEERGERPALVCSPQLRPAVRKLTRTAAPRVPVLSYTELADQLQLDTIGVITGAHAVAA